MTTTHPTRPDDVAVQLEAGPPAPCTRSDEEWSLDGIVVRTTCDRDALTVTVEAPGVAVRRIGLRWRLDMPPGARLLGDHWERGYGDLEWRGVVPERVMPWYMLIFDGRRTRGWGVRIGPAAMCGWQADAAGVTLWLDVRCGGRGVRLGPRALRCAEVVTREGPEGESPFEAARAFCRTMCPQPRPVAEPVYGGNDWYYAYGNNSREQIVADAARIAELSPTGPNRPFMVIDSGWQCVPGGDPADERYDPDAWWDHGNKRFGDMAAVADAIRRAGCRPGIWIRPLAAPLSAPPAMLLPTDRCLGEVRSPSRGDSEYLDPSVPETLERVAADIRRLAGWGFELIKHDYTTFDLLGRWGPDMGHALTNDGWSFADRSRTTAEIVLGLYETIRRAAGDAIVIGCNTVSHLAAGLFELQRTGDDTSGLEWQRTRRMGVNTLAFHMPQHGAFYAADADCVGLTTAVPWALNRQWLELLAASGTPLFVSASPDALGPQQTRALAAAFARAAAPQPPAEPLDWLDTVCPRRWRLGDRDVTFDWYAGAGIELR